MDAPRSRDTGRIAATTVLAAMIFVSSNASSFADADDDALAVIAARENVGMPKTVDETIRLDGFGTAPNHTLLVKYTITNVDYSKLPKDEFIKDQRPILVEMIKKSENFKSILRAGANVKFQYFTEAGALFAEFPFTPRDI